MPDNLIASLSANQVSHLFKFLTSLGTADGIKPEELNALLPHLQLHHHGPVPFPVDRKPLRPAYNPSWQEFVNRERVYDWYSKQANYFRNQSHVPALLTDFPGMDGGQQGHWGNQNDAETWKSPRWNDTILGSVQAGIFNGEGRVVSRSICVRVGDNNEISVCFNPETLTYEAVWSGDFLKFSDVRHGFLHGITMAGAALSHNRGTKPSQPFTYHGFYRHGNRVLFSYQIGGTHYLDSPSLKEGRFHPLVATVDRHPFRNLINDAAPSSPLKFETPIQFGQTEPYAIDTIELPIDNPWKTQLFVGGLNFLPDGSAMICTMHGDVWHVTGIEYPSRTATWRRFASGLHHLLGIVIDEDGIFVLGRDQITRLHDRNNDGVADFYECFSNAYATSPSGHDFICGLQRDENGRFYIASGNQGIVRISKDGKNAEVIATGFRNPDGLGLLPDGTVTVPCSEGEWTPASMICAVRPSSEISFHGYGGPGKSNRNPNGRPVELPLCYLPRGLDNSSGGQTVVNSDRWGPLKDQLLHFSFGTANHFLVLRDEIDGQLQGAVVPLPGEFRSGVHRGRFNAKDGQLYVGGMQGWGCYATDDGCFQRVRYTGKKVQLPIRFKTHSNGIAIEFAEEIDRRIASNPKRHFAQCWNYRYSSGYGSPEFSTKEVGIKGHDALWIKNAFVQNDNKTLFLEIPELQPVNQLHVRIQSNHNVDHDLFVTVHKLDRPFTDFPEYEIVPKNISPHPMLADLTMVNQTIPNPHRKPIPGARQIAIETGTNLSYLTRSFTVQAGEPIRLTLSNPDVVPHNWALIKPGTLQRVGELANKLISDPNATIRHYVPNTPDVLAFTNVVLPREEFSIYFHAPKTPGIYPYLCTFPGHWLAMNGQMKVE